MKNIIILRGDKLSKNNYPAVQFERHGKWTNEKIPFWSIKRETSTLPTTTGTKAKQSHSYIQYTLASYHDDPHRRPKARHVSLDGFIPFCMHFCLWHHSLTCSIHHHFSWCFLFDSPARRTFSSNATAATPNFIKARSGYSFQRAWLSDPSTYPLLVAMAGATAICSGFMVYRLSTDKDIRISDKHKKAQLRP